MPSITLSPSQRLVCERVINVFETGRIRGRYGAISIFKDGPNRIRQITYGRAQTTEYGNLRELVQMYVDAGGMFADRLRPYVARIGVTALVDDDAFKTLLRRAGDEDRIMAQTQDAFFEKRYFQPAKSWAEQHGFTRALSMLVIYDSFIHSGTIHRFLRERFSERPPSSGGREEEWIRQYVDVRHAWLKFHSNPVLRPTVYRTRDLKREIDRGNWDLAMLPISANGTPVDDRPDGAPEFISFTVATGPEAAPAYEWQGLDKSAFLRRNRARLQQEIGTVNALLTRSYGADITALSEQDVWVLTYCEAGLSNGRVDPDFRHSLGERGMLPLPENIEFWNGPGAPAPDRPMPIGTNLHHFYLYLGQLMNKKVRQTPSFSLYDGLFRQGSFRSDPANKAQLLAAVVHGYFIAGNYSDRRVPFEHILEGFDRGLPADEVMRPTRYVHAGKALMSNRARNIAAALSLLASAGPSEEAAPSSAVAQASETAVSAPSIVVDRGEPSTDQPSRPKRFKLKFRAKDALQAAASGPEVAGMDAGRIDWKRDMMVVDGSGEDPDTFAERTARMAQEYGAEVIPDVQYEIDDLFAPGPESDFDPTLDDVVRMVRADRVWGRSRGAGVTIAVIDTGVEGSRPEFRNKVGWHRGLTAHSNTSAWEDTNGHGTMCAAVAAGQGGMGTAREGIAPEARILPCRTTTFYDSDIVRFYDALIQRAQDGEIVVATNSFGLKTASEPPLIDRDLIDVLMKADEAGVHIFFSAGNNHELTGAAHHACAPNTIWLHKSYDCLLTVGTCDLGQNIWSYSSRGPGQFFGEARTKSMPDVMAPTPRNGRVAFGENDRTLTTGWGTSGACPQAAGLAALMLSLDPGLRPAELRDLIRDTARNIPGLGSTCQGNGVIDCEAALNRLASRRSPPAGPQVENQVPGDQQLLRVPSRAKRERKREHSKRE
jgi:chitosanase